MLQDMRNDFLLKKSPMNRPPKGLQRATVAQVCVTVKNLRWITTMRNPIHVFVSQVLLLTVTEHWKMKPPNAAESTKPVSSKVCGRRRLKGCRALELAVQEVDQPLCYVSPLFLLVILMDPEAAPCGTWGEAGFRLRAVVPNTKIPPLPQMSAHRVLETCWS